MANGPCEFSRGHSLGAAAAAQSGSYWVWPWTKSRTIGVLVTDLGSRTTRTSAMPYFGDGKTLTFHGGVVWACLAGLSLECPA